MGTDKKQDDGKYFFIVNSNVLPFFQYLHDTEATSLQRNLSDAEASVLHKSFTELSFSKQLRAVFDTYIKSINSDSREASVGVTALLLQRFSTMFMKSKQHNFIESLSLNPSKKSVAQRQSILSGSEVKG